MITFFSDVYFSYATMKLSDVVNLCRMCSLCYNISLCKYCALIYWHFYLLRYLIALKTAYNLKEVIKKATIRDKINDLSAYTKHSLFV